MTLRPLLLTLAISGAACASGGTAPSEKTESSSAAIRAAEEVGAKNNPTAALHLQLAKEQFENARNLNGTKDQARVDRLLLRAQADAELALALARTEDERAEARGAIDKVKTLKESAPR